MSELDEGALEAAARAIFTSWHGVKSQSRHGARPFTWETAPPNTRAGFLSDARVAVATYLAAAPKEPTNDR